MDISRFEGSRNLTKNRPKIAVKSMKMKRYRLPALNKGYQGEWVQLDFHQGKYYPEVLKYFGVLGTIYLRRRMGGGGGLWNFQ